MLFEKQILEMYKGMMHARCDDNGTAFYFSHNDFKGLECEPYTFTASAGHALKGYLYAYDSPIEGRLIVFDHGFGGGHRAYMREIELICRHGYRVFSYDHTGCMESGGDTPNGMAQSLCDLNDCIAWLKSNEKFAGLDISVMGHSWGGFSTLNISAIHKEISHVVVFSGFVSVKDLVASFFGGVMKGYRKAIMNLELEANPEFSLYNAVESLKESSAKALLIYSENDALVKKKHYAMLKNGLSERKNTEFILVKDKGHNPNYTEDAVKYLGQYVSEKNRLMKKGKLNTDEEKSKFLSSFDWKRMTEQDDKIWSKIFEFLAI